MERGSSIFQNQRPAFLGGEKAGQTPLPGHPRFLVRAGAGLCGKERHALSRLCPGRMDSQPPTWRFPSTGLEGAEQDKHHAHSTLKPPFFCVRGRNKETRCEGVRGEELRRVSGAGSHSKAQAKKQTSGHRAARVPGARNSPRPARSITIAITWK